MPLDIFSKINKALAGVDRPARFVASGRLPLTLPGLEVDGVGPISLPLPKNQAKKLIKVAHRAPYGKGTETLVDTEIRRVWEIDPEQIIFSTSHWDEALELVIWAVQQQLGLEGQKLKARLYKMLVYEKDSFFLPHKDSEKSGGMVATCVLTIPSEHEGGQLIVRHDGREEKIDFSRRKDRDSLQFAAFYSDCEHEVKRLTSGYRLSLIYNLVLSKSRRNKLKPPTYGVATATVTDVLNEWQSSLATATAVPAGRLTVTGVETDEFPSDKDNDSAPCIAISLDYEYTEAGLSIATLKGADRARADVIQAAAARAGCRSYIGLVTLWESGYAEDPNDDYRSRRYGRRWDYDDVADDQDSHTEYSMIEVYEWSLTVSQLLDSEGRCLPAQLILDEKWFVDPARIRAVTPEQEYEGFTGNAGNTLERWYRHAVILIWPES